MFCGLRNSTFHPHRGDWVMAECSYLVELIPKCTQPSAAGALNHNTYAPSWASCLKKCGTMSSRTSDFNSGTCLQIISSEQSNLSGEWNGSPGGIWPSHRDFRGLYVCSCFTYQSLAVGTAIDDNAISGSNITSARSPTQRQLTI